MKIILTTILIISSFAAGAWDIIKEKDYLYLVKKKYEIKQKIFALNEKTKVEVIPLSKEFIILRYLESQSGTKYQSQTYNCSIFNSRQKKFVAVDQLCKSIVTSADGKKSVTEASFKLAENKILYSFEELSEEFSLTR